MPNPQGQIGMKGPFEVPYETGIWVPVDVSGAGLVWAFSNAWYAVIGDIVFACALIIFPVTVDVTDNDLRGLPFNIVAGTPCGTNISWNDVGSEVVMSAEGTDFFRFRKNTAAAYKNNELSGKEVDFMFIYRRA